MCIYTHTHTNTHTMGNYSAIKKKKKNAICSNMDGPGGIMLSEVKTNTLSFICGI